MGERARKAKKKVKKEAKKPAEAEGSLAEALAWLSSKKTDSDGNVSDIGGVHCEIALQRVEAGLFPAKSSPEFQARIVKTKCSASAAAAAAGKDAASTTVYGDRLAKNRAPLWNNLTPALPVRSASDSENGILEIDIWSTKRRLLADRDSPRRSFKRTAGLGFARVPVKDVLTRAHHGHDAALASPALTLRLYTSEAAALSALDQGQIYPDSISISPYDNALATAEDDNSEELAAAVVDVGEGGGFGLDFPRVASTGVSIDASVPTVSLFLEVYGWRPLYKRLMSDDSVDVLSALSSLVELARDEHTRKNDPGKLLTYVRGPVLRRTGFLLLSPQSALGPAATHDAIIHLQTIVVSLWEALTSPAFVSDRSLGTSVLPLLGSHGYLHIVARILSHIDSPSLQHDIIETIKPFCKLPALQGVMIETGLLDIIVRLLSDNVDVRIQLRAMELLMRMDAPEYENAVVHSGAFDVAVKALHSADVQVASKALSLVSQFCPGKTDYGTKRLIEIDAYGHLLQLLEESKSRQRSELHHERALHREKTQTAAKLARKEEVGNIDDKTRNEPPDNYLSSDSDDEWIARTHLANLRHTQLDPLSCSPAYLKFESFHRSRRSELVARGAATYGTLVQDSNSNPAFSDADVKFEFASSSAASSFSDSESDDDGSARRRVIRQPIGDRGGKHDVLVLIPRHTTNAASAVCAERPIPVHRGFECIFTTRILIGDGQDAAPHGGFYFDNADDGETLTGGMSFFVHAGVPGTSDMAVDTMGASGLNYSVAVCFQPGSAPASTRRNPNSIQVFMSDKADGDSSTEWQSRLQFTTNLSVDSPSRRAFVKLPVGSAPFDNLPHRVRIQYQSPYLRVFLDDACTPVLEAKIGDLSVAFGARTKFVLDSYQRLFPEAFKSESSSTQSALHMWAGFGASCGSHFLYWQTYEIRTFEVVIGGSRYGAAASGAGTEDAEHLQSVIMASAMQPVERARLQSNLTALSALVTLLGTARHNESDGPLGLHDVQFERLLSFLLHFLGTFWFSPLQLRSIRAIQLLGTIEPFRRQLHDAKHGVLAALLARARSAIDTLTVRVVALEVLMSDFIEDPDERRLLMSSLAEFLEPDGVPSADSAHAAVPFTEVSMASHAAKRTLRALFLSFIERMLKLDSRKRTIDFAGECSDAGILSRLGDLVECERFAARAPVLRLPPLRQVGSYGQKFADSNNSTSLSSSSSDSDDRPGAVEWFCGACTFRNARTNITCQVCETPKNDVPLILDAFGEIVAQVAVSHSSDDSKDEPAMSAPFPPLITNSSAVNVDNPLLPTQATPSDDPSLAAVDGDDQMDDDGQDTPARLTSTEATNLIGVGDAERNATEISGPANVDIAVPLNVPVCTETPATMSGPVDIPSAMLPSDELTSSQMENENEIKMREPLEASSAVDDRDTVLNMPAARKEWTCSICTFVNADMNATSCLICDSPHVAATLEQSSFESSSLQVDTVFGTIPLGAADQAPPAEAQESDSESSSDSSSSLDVQQFLKSHLEDTELPTAMLDDSNYTDAVTGSTHYHKKWDHPPSDVLYAVLSIIRLLPSVARKAVCRCSCSQESEDLSCKSIIHTLVRMLEAHLWDALDDEMQVEKPSIQRGQLHTSTLKLMLILRKTHQSEFIRAGVISALCAALSEESYKIYLPALEDFLTFPNPAQTNNCKRQLLKTSEANGDPVLSLLLMCASRDLRIAARAEEFLLRTFLFETLPRKKGGQVASELSLRTQFLFYLLESANINNDITLFAHKTNLNKLEDDEVVPPELILLPDTDNEEELYLHNIDERSAAVVGTNGQCTQCEAFFGHLTWCELGANPGIGVPTDTNPNKGKRRKRQQFLAGTHVAGTMPGQQPDLLMLPEHLAATLAGRRVAWQLQHGGIRPLRYRVVFCDGKAQAIDAPRGRPEDMLTADARRWTACGYPRRCVNLVLEYCGHPDTVPLLTHVLASTASNTSAEIAFFVSDSKRSSHMVSSTSSFDSRSLASWTALVPGSGSETSSAPEAEGVRPVAVFEFVASEAIKNPDDIFSPPSCGRCQGLLDFLGTRMDDGWVCDAMQTPGGCVRNCRMAGQSTGWGRYRCVSGCNYDLCDGCYAKMRHSTKDATPTNDSIRGVFCERGLLNAVRAHYVHVKIRPDRAAFDKEFSVALEHLGFCGISLPEEQWRTVRQRHKKATRKTLSPTQEPPGSFYEYEVAGRTSTGELAQTRHRLRPRSIEGVGAVFGLQSTSKLFEYKSDFDKNGLLYWLGSQCGRTASWVNPYTAGKIGVSTSHSLFSSNMKTADIVGRRPAQCYWGGTVPNFFIVDLREYRLRCSHLTLRHGFALANSFLSSSQFQFSGSDDGVSWTVLFDSISLPYHERTQRFVAGFSTYTWRLNPIANRTHYRYYRVQMTGNNDSHRPYMCIAGCELYGDVVLG